MSFFDDPTARRDDLGMAEQRSMVVLIIRVPFIQKARVLSLHLAEGLLSLIWCPCRTKLIRVNIFEITKI